jgi:hypothetical protein
VYAVTPGTFYQPDLMAFGNIIVTLAGDTMLAQAQAGLGQITPTSIAAGTGFASGTDDPTTFTALKTPIWTGIAILAASADTPQQAAIEVEFNGSVAPSVFQLNEIGIYAKIGAGSPVLFAYVSRTAADGDTISPGVVRDYILTVKYSNATTVSLVVNIVPAVAVHAPTHRGAGTSGAGFDPIGNSTTANSGLLASVPMAKNYSPISIGDGTHGWAPIFPVIIANTTLYVSKTGNDSTALPNNASFPWAEIQGALNYLSNWLIAPGVTVTISVGAGVYASSTTIGVNHAQGSQIDIIGVVTSSVNSTAASASSSTVALTGSWPGINVGDYIIAACGTGGQTAQMASGVFKVVSNNGSVLTYNCGVVIPVAFSGTPTFSVRKLSSVLTFSAGVSGISIAGNGIGLFQNFAIVGSASGSLEIGGISVSGACVATIETCGATGWFDSSVNSSGFQFSQGVVVTANDCHANANSNGFVTSYLSTQLNATSCIANVNTYGGFRNNQSNMTLVSCWAHGNDGGGFVVANKAVSSLNGSLSFYSTSGALVSVASLIYTVGACQFLNSGTDINLAVSSTFIRESGTATSYSTHNVTPNTLSADGCYFSP